MSKIWTKNGFQSENEWGFLSEGAEYLSVEDAKGSSKGNLAVRVEPADDVNDLSDKLGDIAIIAVNFPAFADGRAFSHAALLRDRFGFKGEIRAFGQVLLDQVPLMLRCGIDSFEVSDEATIKHLDAGHIPGIEHHYQPSMNEPAKANSYSWRYMANSG
ncbi:MAG: DUF934 domain-containing protein [Lentilitoribacter sp.]